MNETELRALFQAAGHERTPDAFHSIVMEQVLTQAPASVVKPLISPRQWLMAAFILVTATALACVASLYSPGAPSTEFTLPFHVDFSSVEPLLHNASWIAMTMGVVFVFTLMDQALARTHARSAL